MTEPNTPRPTRRSNAEYRWNKAKMIAFMRCLALTGSVAHAARSVGMSRQSAYRLRARGGAIAAMWDEGVRIGRRAGLAGPAGLAGRGPDRSHGGA